MSALTRKYNCLRRSVSTIVCALPSLRHTSMLLGLFLFVGCLTSQQHSSASQRQFCSDNFTCCHTEIDVADQTGTLNNQTTNRSKQAYPSGTLHVSGTLRHYPVIDWEEHCAGEGWDKERSERGREGLLYSRWWREITAFCHASYALLRQRDHKGENSDKGASFWPIIDFFPPCCCAVRVWLCNVLQALAGGRCCGQDLPLLVFGP